MRRSLSRAAAAGRLDGLRVLRDVVAGKIEAEGPSAALVRELREVMREIGELEKALPKGSVVDDLASRRKSRRAGAAGVAEAGPGGRKQRPRSS